MEKGNGTDFNETELIILSTLAKLPIMDREQRELFFNILLPSDVEFGTSDDFDGVDNFIEEDGPYNDYNVEEED